MSGWQPLLGGSIVHAHKLILVHQQVSSAAPANDVALLCQGVKAVIGSDCGGFPSGLFLVYFQAAGFRLGLMSSGKSKHLR